MVVSEIAVLVPAVSGHEFDHRTGGDHGYRTAPETERWLVAPGSVTASGSLVLLCYKRLTQQNGQQGSC
jgi:hypothetical protein